MRIQKKSPWGGKRPGRTQYNRMFLRNASGWTRVGPSQYLAKIPDSMQRFSATITVHNRCHNQIFRRLYPYRSRHEGFPISRVDWIKARVPVDSSSNYFTVALSRKPSRRVLKEVSMCCASLTTSVTRLPSGTTFYTIGIVL